MRKGFRILTAVLLSVTLCLPAFAGCGGGGTSDTPGTSTSATAEYSIDVGSLVLPAAEVQRTYTIKIPRVVDRSGNAMTGSEYEVTIKSVTDPNGDEVVVQGDKFVIPAIGGNYTVTFTCAAEGVADATAAFAAVDSEDPVIGRRAVTQFGIVGNPIPVPEFNVTDNNDLPEDSTVIEIIDPDGTKVTPTDGWFTPQKAGDWTYRVTVTDAGMNTVSQEMDLYVADVELVPDKLTYFDDPDLALKQAVSFSGRDQDISYVTNAEMPAGTEFCPKPSEEELKGGLKITPAAGVKASLTISNVIYDWSEYDYIGFWAYNGGNADITVNIGYQNITNGQLSPGEWQFIAIWCAGDQYNEAWNYLQKDEHIVEWALYDDLGKNEGSVYIGPISGYKYASDKVMAWDQPYGRMHLSPHMAHRDVSTYAFTPTVKDESDKDAAGSMRVRITKATPEWQMRVLKPMHIPQDHEGNNFYVTAWVHNPLDKDIKVYCNADNPETGGEDRLETVIPAGGSGYARLALRADIGNAWASFDDNPWQFFFLCAQYADGTSFAAGDEFYIGGFSASE